MSLMVNDVNISDFGGLTLNINDLRKIKSRKRTRRSMKEHFERSQSESLLSTPKSDPLSIMIPDGVPTSSDFAVPDVNPNVNVCLEEDPAMAGSKA
ncbi:hypothetical protein AVEN_51338-1 [Araneus ventricosus]|uniref:Uncharacterized protein n=1 Tax=Araneus ventricosus TaxID=182803 RepID=A0A4Y2L598_ARAVE|nr:hypothetical protein AVEN_51338-1 [Araneus ventricosus]